MQRNIDGLESVVHGRRRKLEDIIEDGVADEARFGVMQQPMFLARGKKIPNSQWTGCVTGIAVSMLESDMVDAVVCIAGEDGPDGWCNPKPILARSVEDVLRGRGVKPALAPSLNVLDQLKENPDIRRLLFCGVGCAVQAFRAIEKYLGLEEVYVLGTNCADNSPSPEAARNFLQRSVPELKEKKIEGYEFMQDFRVHVKYDSETYERLPYFCKSMLCAHI
eukprot:scaffold3030_cov72-Cyclotella_meneghiniana.AAC.9